MVDITDYAVDDVEGSNFKANIEGEDIYLYVPEGDPEKMESENYHRKRVYSSCRDADYLLYERITENTPIVPYVVSTEDNLHLFSYIMKKLHKHTGTICFLHDEIPILCCPDMRVSKEMLEEIHETFASICREKSVDYTPTILEYIPLSSPITCYKDQSLISLEMAIPGSPAIALSSDAEIEVKGGRTKTVLSKEKKNAICDSILLSDISKVSDRYKAAQLAPLISVDRSRDMHHFISIGRCLHNIFRGDMDGLELWKSMTISQRQDACDEYWADVGTTSTLYTIRYLQYCASNDSPSEYKKWNSTSVRGAIEESVLATGGILDVATAAYRIDPTLYISEGDNYTEAAFYKFNGTYYATTGENDMRNYLDRKLIKAYKTFLRDLAKTLDNTPDNSVKVMLQGKMDNTIRIITKLKDPAYQLNVVKVMCRLYNIPGFSYMKNSNRNLFVFEDCVFDCEKKSIRPGIPEDYMTVSTEYTFLEEWNTYTWEDPLVVLVQEHMAKIVHNPEKLDFLWSQLWKRLRGYNSDKRGITLYGFNNNAKSALCTWWSKCFGNHYFPNVPSNLLYSEDTHPGTASPHWQMIANARLFAMTEISDTHVLNEGNFKKITGSTDPITFRGLYSKRIEFFIPGCVPFTICNSLPKMNGNSAALRNRVVLLKLDSKFITKDNVEWEELKEMSEEDRAKYMEENHWYWADPAFDSMMARTYKAYMWILIQKFLEDKSVPIPQCVIEDTINYFNKSNVYLQFVRQCIRKDASAQGISTYTVFSIFKKWYSDNIARFTQVSFPKFLEEMESIRFTPINDSYRGISIIYK
jgi:phage/plasmid-associated DNA primase